MPTLTIDGKRVTVEAGTNLVEAARLAGIEIPVFCYHPHLSIAANCRMCLVRLTVGGQPAPKPVPACQTVAADGMVVDASSDEVKKLRQAILEFILLNHPLDCPICDKAGECDLQDNYFKHSNRPARVEAADKEQKDKRVALGPRIVYDGERCILCTRCVRFMSEVAKDSQLGTLRRGDRSVISTAPGQQFDHPYSVNTVDICPVGALTDVEFRFKQRSWFLRPTPSICGGCARGCNIHIDVSALDNRVYRIRPRLNDAVNGPWMCDDGRLSIRETDDGRLATPRLRRGGSADLATAIAAAAERLKPFHGAEEMALAISAGVTCEDAFAAALLAQRLLDPGRVAVIGRPDWQGDAFLRLADRNANRLGVTEVLKALGLDARMAPAPALLEAMERGEVKALLAIGNPWPVADGDRVAAAIRELEASVALLSHDDAVAAAVDVALPIAGLAEQDGTYLNATCRLQRVRPARGWPSAPRGVSEGTGASGVPAAVQPAWSIVRALAGASGSPLGSSTLSELFGLMAAQVPRFGGLSLDAIPPEGVPLAGETRAPRCVGDWAQQYR
ncbi:MAG: (2Fe-2S)-binding protein [Deltaproteobacteria bacterium]|nr:(2Fe-2S)-binding protein [Deltaproteobacteria bacterium]